MKDGVVFKDIGDIMKFFREKSEESKYKSDAVSIFFHYGTVLSDEIDRILKYSFTKEELELIDDALVDLSLETIKSIRHCEHRIGTIEENEEKASRIDDLRDKIIDKLS